MKRLHKLHNLSIIALTTALCTYAHAAPVHASKTLLPGASWQTVIVKSGDSLEKIFKNIGLDLKQLQQILSANKATSKALSHIKPGQTMTVQTAPGHKLLQLKYTLADDRQLWVQRASEGFNSVIKKAVVEATKQPKPVASGVHYVSGTIHHSLAETAKSTGMNYAMMNQLTQVFNGQVNFKHLQPGDHFSLIYQASAQNSTNGTILAAEFNNRNTAYRAVRYTDYSGHTAYYDPKGKSFAAATSFLRYPIQFKRISSPFSYKRYDPVVHRVHSHLGVDLAAPRGTPIKSIGDGKIEFMGRRGGYGNTVIVSYGNHYKALFGHLSRFNTSLKHNSTVKQGQVIGYVGSTGWATGSHVHYELHVNGVPKDPLRVALPQVHPIENHDRLKFLEQSKVLLAQLELFQRPELAANAPNRHGL